MGGSHIRAFAPQIPNEESYIVYFSKPDWSKDVVDSSDFLK